MNNSIQAKIKKAYQQVADQYNSDRQSWHQTKFFNQFLDLLPAQALVLDVGCGAGVPVAESLMKKGHLVLGLDFSEKQVALARKNCPHGDFQVKDIADLQPGEYQVDAIACVYVMFHLPRTQHLAMLRIFNSFLPVGGTLMITMGDCDFEGWHDFYGTQVWSSQYGPAKNRQLIQEAGFKIVFDELGRSGQEKHQLIVAQKII